MARRRSWMGKPEDYRRAFPLPGDDAPPVPMTGEDIGAKVQAIAAAMGHTGQRVSLEQMAQWRPDRVKAVYAGPDGSLVDEAGNRVDVGNRIFIPAAPPEGDPPSPAPPGLPPMLAQALGMRGNK